MGLLVILVVVTATSGCGGRAFTGEHDAGTVHDANATEEPSTDSGVDAPRDGENEARHDADDDGDQALEGCPPERVWEGEYWADDPEALARLDGYTGVTGFLVVSNAADLTALHCLREVGRDLLIDGNHWVGESVTSLAGLESLVSVGGILELSQTLLTSLEGLESLTTVGERPDSRTGLGGLRLRSNPSLVSLRGLEGLTGLSGL